MDMWIGRLTILGQVVVLLVSGTLIALGHDSVITDLFCAAGGGLLTAGVLKTVTRTTTP